MISDCGFLTQFVKSEDPDEALQLIKDAIQSKSNNSVLQSRHIHQLMIACLQRNATELCSKIYQRMSSAQSLASPGDSLRWPEADLELFSFTVLALTRFLKVKEALDVLESVRSSSMNDSQEIVFGQVVNSPLFPYPPLTVVQPQEGVKIVPCSTSRYLFEVFSGAVTSVTSDATENASDVFITAARFLKLWRKPRIKAVHKMIVTTPSGIPRTFRFGTESAEVPAKLNDRVTVVCAPERITEKVSGILDPIPQGIRPGEAITVVNHRTGQTTPVLRAPRDQSMESLPPWVVPLAVVLAGSDAASSLIDSNLPLIGAATIAAVGASVVIGNSTVLPKLKQLPESRLGGELLRQDLLRQHQGLVSRLDELFRESSIDVRTLAKLWQLESKMTSVDSSGKYNARIERIDQARQNLEVKYT